MTEVNMLMGNGLDNGVKQVNGNGIHHTGARNGSIYHEVIDHPSDLYKVKDLVLRDATRAIKTTHFLNSLILKDEDIERIGDVFESEMDLALSEKKSSLQMENTYIPELPNGTENGRFLALDLGGTNFRVILLEIEAGQITSEIVKRYHIPDDTRVGIGIGLFDHLAACVDDFVHENGIENEQLAMGFTFSFPMSQHSLRSAVLKCWTKSFKIESLVGQDVVEMLQESLKKRGLDNIDVLCILNDTTGTLVQGAALDKRAKIGIILGTGANAAYLERAEKVKHWETDRHGEKNVIIDIEWGAFGDNGTLDFIRTKFDIEVNTATLHPSFTFEKYISGKYLGELARVVLSNLVQNGLLFAQAPKNLFPDSWKFGTDLVSNIEQDTISNTNTNTIDVLKQFGYKYIEDYDEDDISVVQNVCELVSHRAAKLVSICTARLLNRMKDDDITVAVDGSLYKHHPRFKAIMQRYIEVLTVKKFHLMLAEDGSGKGAGLVAAIAQRLL